MSSSARGEAPSRGLGEEYLGRVARVGAILFATGMLLAIVVHAHWRANQSVETPSFASEAGDVNLVLLPSSQDDEVETLDVIGVNFEPLPLRPAIAVPGFPATTIGRVAVDLPASLPMLAQPFPGIGGEIESIGSDVLAPSPTEVLLVYTTGTEIYGYSSKFGAVRPFEKDPPARTPTKGTKARSHRTRSGGSAPHDQPLNGPSPSRFDAGPAPEIEAAQ